MPARHHRWEVHLALRRGAARALRALLAEGAMVDERAWAIAKGRAVVEVLLEAGVDPNANVKRRHPIYLAIARARCGDLKGAREAFAERAARSRHLRELAQREDPAIVA